MPEKVEKVQTWKGRQDFSTLIERRAAAKLSRIADGKGEADHHDMAKCTKTGCAICATFHRKREYFPKQAAFATFDGQM